MEHTLQETVNRLPLILERNAPRMMRRMVAHMKPRLEARAQSGSVSHGMLFLRVAEEDLVRNFTAAVHAAFVKDEPSDFAGLSLEPEGGPVEDAAFQSSDAAFDQLAATAARLRVHGLERYRKAKFIEVMLDAFARSRMDARATTELIPYARAALNAELQGLYAKLESLGSASSGG